ncbi:hypothetical protein CC86DRAFT_198413 [Ophiobolus disseminans]|uniref:Uncharacterized protein n=1 Tax=Ophiobolus disseminans TaxID=1469910 RepID=A0A6A7A7U0_9PLEO|nr:hypothetical protein CC86DRAFT_198413 [Ophiobolus disseminans]
MPSKTLEIFMTGREYRTERAMKTNPKYDITPVGSTGSRLHVVHPLPGGFPWRYFSAEQRDDVLNHVDETIRLNNASPDFLDAVGITKINLDAAQKEAPATASTIITTATTTTDTSTTLNRTIPGSNIPPSQLAVPTTPTKTKSNGVAPRAVLEEDNNSKRYRISSWQDNIEAGCAPSSRASSPSRDESFWTAQSNRSVPPSPESPSKRLATRVTPQARALVDSPSLAPSTELMALERRLNLLNDSIDNHTQAEDMQVARHTIRSAREALFQARSPNDPGQIGLFEVKKLVESAEDIFQDLIAAIQIRASTSIRTSLTQYDLPSRNLATERHMSQSRGLALQNSPGEADDEVEEIRPRGAAEEARSHHRRPATPPPSYRSPAHSSANASLHRQPSTSRTITSRTASQINALRAQNTLLEQNPTAHIDLHWVGDSTNSVCRCQDPETVHPFGSSTLVRDANVQTRCTEFFCLNPGATYCIAQRWEAIVL